MANDAPVGIFDSGIGGISVYKKIRERLPSESILYVADQANIPYGSKELGTIFEFSKSITDFLLLKKCKIIVIACNTACAAALHPLRKIYPEVLFVGMEPALKPAAQNTKSGAVGILATEGTFKGDPYAGVVRRFAQNVQVYEQPCTGLAEAIERGLDDAELDSMLEKWIIPLKEKHVDQLALACTHYPLVYERICAIAGEGIKVIDPAEAIARRVESLLSDNCLLATSVAEDIFYTTAQQTDRLSEVAASNFKNIKYCTRNGDRCLVEL